MNPLRKPNPVAPTRVWCNVGDKSSIRHGMGVLGNAGRLTSTAENFHLRDLPAAGPSR